MDMDRNQFMAGFLEFRGNDRLIGSYIHCKRYQCRRHVLRDAHTAGERQHVDRSRDQGLQEDNGPKTGSRKSERLIDAPY